MTGWQFLVEGKCPSRANMERDRNLVETLRSNQTGGIIRIYDWDEPAVTIGYHQRHFSFFDKELNLPVISRPTGGGAVLHDNDITFCICTEQAAPLSGSITESYTFVSLRFVSALTRCGMDVRIEGEHTRFSPVCFARSAPVEIVAAGSKIMGLALRRCEGYLLFQGVLPVRVDKGLVERVFGHEQAGRSCGIVDIMPGFRTEKFTECLIDAFAGGVKIPFSVQRNKDDAQRHQGYQGKIHPR